MLTIGDFLCQGVNIVSTFMTTIDMSDTRKPPTLFTLREVADMLRVHRRTVYRLITEGNIKAIKIGSQWRVTEGSLMHFIHSGWQESDSDGKKGNGPAQYKLPLE